MLYRALEWSLMSLMRHVGTIHWTRSFKLLPPRPSATWFATSIVINKFKQRYPFPPSIFVKTLIILRSCSKFWGWDMLISFFLSGLSFLDVLGHQLVPCVQFPPGPSVGVTNVQRTKPEPQTQRSASIRPTLHWFHFAFQLSSLKMEPTTVGFFFFGCSNHFDPGRTWGTSPCVHNIGQTLTCVTIDRIIGLPWTNLVLQNIYIHENVPDQIV